MKAPRAALSLRFARGLRSAALLGALACAALAVGAQERPPAAKPGTGPGAGRTQEPAPKPPAPAKTPAPEPAPETPLELPDAERWRAMIERDKRIKFTARTAATARSALAKPDLPPARRAIAWMALGCASVVADRDSIQDAAFEAEGVEARAAVLALGEMAAGAGTLRFEQREHGPLEISESTLLALLRSDRPAARAPVEAIARDPAHPMAETAANLLVFDADPLASTPVRASVELLALRWEAARVYGLVDGETWEVVAVRKLAQDPEFVREVVVRASGKLRRPGIKDHQLQVLLSDKGTGRLHAAVDALPIELSKLVANDLWLPKDSSEWKIVLDAISEAGVEALTLDVLERAAADPLLHYRAVALLARTSQAELTTLVDPDLARLSPEDRIDVCSALGASGDPGWIKRLTGLSEDGDPRVRAAAHAALWRLGNKAAGSWVRDRLFSPGHADHAAAVSAACGLAHDPAVALLLEEALPKVREQEAAAIAMALCFRGRLTARSYVRTALASDRVVLGREGSHAVELVRALRHDATVEDIDALEALFPREGDRALDIELAHTLVELASPSIVGILRAGLWSREFDVSMLASAQIVETFNLHVLREEIGRAPASATSNDLRRVGYALGQWGGMPQVQELARVLRYNSGDPALQGALLGALAARTQ